MTKSATFPEACDRLFGEHVNAGDLEALLALYEPGCSFVRPRTAAWPGATRRSA